MRSEPIIRCFFKKRPIKACKNAFIVFLLMLTLFLIRETGLFSDAYESVELFRKAENIFLSLWRGGADSYEAEGGESFLVAAIPLSVAITFDDGSRHAVKYSSQVKNIYEHFRVLLGETLGSAGEPLKTDASKWESVLSSGGVYFDFMSGQPLSALSEWVGGGTVQNAIAGHSARRILIAKVGEELELYYINEKDGAFYQVTTALSSFSLDSLTQGFLPNGAAFEYENSQNEGLDPYFLFIGEMPAIQSVEARLPQINVQEELIPLFGMNRYAVEIIPVAGSGEGYIENDMRLEISPEGRISFKSTLSSMLGTGNVTAFEAVEAALRIASACLKPTQGRDYLSLTSLEYYEEEMEYRIVFSYVLSGLPVVYPDGRAAAEITIKNGVLASAVINVREYSLIDRQYEMILPEQQEMGIVAHAGGGEPRLVYEDGGGAVRAAWHLG